MPKIHHVRDFDAIAPYDATHFALRLNYMACGCSSVTILVARVGNRVSWFSLGQDILAQR